MLVNLFPFFPLSNSLILKQESPPEFLGSAKLAVSRLKATFLDREAEIIVRRLLEWATGLDWHQILIRPNDPFPGDSAQKFALALDRILKNEPLQYITGVQWFHGHPFRVTPQVLIPRPETEELVEWVRQEAGPLPHPSILDVGTGSGAISVSLSLYIRSASVFAIDLSPGALAVAKENNEQLGGNVKFTEMDILHPEMDAFQGLDIIVSNPPYVPTREMDEMQAQVKEFEPHLALFVPDNDPLVFYRAILDRAQHWLKPGGWVFFELHRDQGDALLALAEEMGFRDGCLKRDLQGNVRMAKWVWPG